MSVVILSACRTPIGRLNGALAAVRPDDLAAVVVAEALRRSGVDATQVEDVILGAANQAGEDNRNVGRMAALLAGLPVEVGGLTVNRLCASGLQAVVSAAHAIAAGDGRVMVAGGVESMTRAPYVLGKADAVASRTQTLQDTTLGWRFPNPALRDRYGVESMGETGENVAERYAISRNDQDAWALRSQQRYAAAHAAGHFVAEIVPVLGIAEDEHPRPATTPDGLAKLESVFRTGGSVTAGNAAGLNDGTAALVLADEQFAQEHGLQARARVVASAVAGVEPSLMGIGPVPAVRKALSRAGLEISDIDLVELNEAFASQAVASIRALEIDPDRVNVNGGAIALGHPLGATGARMLVTLLHELERRKARYGLATMCIGVGQGMALVIERAP